MSGKNPVLIVVEPILYHITVLSYYFTTNFNRDSESIKNPDSTRYGMEVFDVSYHIRNKQTDIMGGGGFRAYILLGIFLDFLSRV